MFSWQLPSNGEILTNSLTYLFQAGSDAGATIFPSLALDSIAGVTDSPNLQKIVLNTCFFQKL